MIPVGKTGKLVGKPLPNQDPDHGVEGHVAEAPSSALDQPCGGLQRDEGTGD